MAESATQSGTLEPSALDLSACDREPIHIPGAIQPHGVLLSLAATDFTVLQASENISDLLGVTVERVLGSRLSCIWGQEVEDLVASALPQSEFSVKPLRLRLGIAGENVLFDAAVHWSEGIVVLEIENPRLLEDSTPEQLLDRHYRLIQETVAEISKSSEIEAIADVITRDIRGFTGFDRVMVYRFEEDGHGWVVAENKAEFLEPYLGLHFPATDIPQQARRLYTSNWLRLIADVNYAPSPITPTINPLSGRPLDLSQSLLRSVSPVHVQYLKNMRVGSSMSISIMRGEELWGLIACHHKNAKFVSYATRTACVLFGTVLSSQIIAAEQNLRTEHRSRKQRLLSTLLQDVSQRENVTAGLLENPETLLALMDAAGAAISFSGEVSLVGSTPSPERVEHILSQIDAARVPEVFATESFSEHFPDAQRDAATACGLVAVRFPSGDYLLFFRPEVVRTVRWAGNPHHPATPSPKGSPIPLTPRASFAEWSETVRLRSLPWDPVELQLAQELRNGLSVYILRREAELSQLNRQLAAKNEEMRQFLYTISHDLKSPLITCRGFISLLREDLAAGRLDDIPDFARRVDDAAAHMGRLLDDLLELYRLGRSIRAAAPVALHEFVSDIQQEFSARLNEKGAEFIAAEDLPEELLADRVALKRVVDNLVSNALKYACDGPDRTIVIGGTIEREETRIYVRDKGPGIVKGQREKVFQLFQRFAPPGTEGTGVGLASVATVMRLHGGRAWVEETPGGGATFWVAFPKEPQSWKAVGGATSASHS